MVNKDEEKDLWMQYVATRDGVTRGRLIEQYLDSARKVAARLFYHRTDESLEFADYLQLARVGLVEAIDRFDPSREASFTTFATYRMQGAILNGVEKHNERLAQLSFQKKNKKERIDSMIADESCGKGDGLFERMAGVAIGLAVGHLLEAPLEVDVDESIEGSPYASLAMERLRAQLRAIVDTLPDREKRIISMHYFQHIAFNEIANMLELSNGRVSQLHARAITLIREAYARLGTFDMAL